MRVALRAGVCLLSVYGTHQSEQEQWAAPRYSDGAVSFALAVPQLVGRCCCRRCRSVGHSMSLYIPWRAGRARGLCVPASANNHLG